MPALRKHELQFRQFKNLNVYHHAVEGGNLDCIKQLIRGKPSLAKQIWGPEGKTLLMFESVFKDKLLLEYLVESGADPDHLDRRSRNALHRAACFLQSILINNK